MTKTELFQYSLVVISSLLLLVYFTYKKIDHWKEYTAVTYLSQGVVETWIPYNDEFGTTLRVRNISDSLNSLSTSLNRI